MPASEKSKSKVSSKSKDKKSDKKDKKSDSKDKKSEKKDKKDKSERDKSVKSDKKSQKSSSPSKSSKTKDKKDKDAKSSKSKKEDPNASVSQIDIADLKIEEQNPILAEPTSPDVLGGGDVGQPLAGGLQTMPIGNNRFQENGMGSNPIRGLNDPNQFASASVGGYGSQDRKKNCLLHKQPLRYFCDSCEELICYECTVMGPHNTQLHRISAIGDSFKYRFDSENKSIH